MNAKKANTTVLKIWFARTQLEASSVFVRGGTIGLDVHA